MGCEKVVRRLKDTRYGRAIPVLKYWNFLPSVQVWSMAVWSYANSESRKRKIPFGHGVLLLLPGTSTRKVPTPASA
eukprot:3937257-Rhodomonas_salina.3